MNAGLSTGTADVRTVIVTGAGGGLGRAMSHRLLRDGFQCVVSDVKKAEVETTIELAGSDGVRAIPLVGDIRAPEDRDRLISCAVSQPGTLYGLVNNAGIGRLRPLLDETPQDWRAIFETNLEAAYFLAQAAIEYMRQQGRGRIVNIASVHGMVGLNNQGLGSRAPEATERDRGPVRQTAYAASKGGLIQLTRDLAAAVGRWGITVNSVSPGNVPHGDGSERQVSAQPDPIAPKQWRPPQLGDKIDSDVLRVIALRTPLQRVGKVEEIAGPVSFLLSDDATYITGANLVVDGGYTIW